MWRRLRLSEDLERGGVEGERRNMGEGLCMTCRVTWWNSMMLLV